MYKHIATSYNRLHGEEQQRKLRRLLEVQPIKTGKTVADIGCGTAHLHTFFNEQTYVGVDPCQELLDQAPSNVHTICSPGENIPLEDQSQDLVLSLTALHNYDDPMQGVKELHRIAKDLVLVGILKKSQEHERIVKTLKTLFRVQQVIEDQHDTLLVLHKI